MDVGESVTIERVDQLRRLQSRFLQEPWYTTKMGLGRITIPPTSASCDATMQWFRKLLLDCTAYIKVIDFTQEPLVEMYTKIRDKKFECLNAYLIEEMVAVACEKESLLGGSDEETDDEEGPFQIVPG